MSVLVDHEDCKGWVFVAPETLDGDSKNYHVVEVAKIYRDEKGKEHATMFSPCITICKRGMARGWSNYYKAFRRTPDGEKAARTELANMQNSGKEVCGACVSRFYADN